MSRIESDRCSPYHLPMRQLADQGQVGKLIEKLAQSIARDLDPQQRSGQWALVGIRSRGEIIAQRLAEILDPDHLGTLDITLYRDDAATALPSPRIGASHIPFDIEGRRIVLVDDVLYTGRTIRAALDAVLDYGRPRRIELAVVADRGGRGDGLMNLLLAPPPPSSCCTHRLAKGGRPPRRPRPVHSSSLRQTQTTTARRAAGILSTTI